MIKPQDGTWYIVVTCDKCASTIVLFPDLTEGQGSLHANYIVTCPRCGHKGGYEAKHYFHPTGTSGELSNSPLN
jgi:predicted nucleic-acid-binding Zn-ribbon protein